MRKMMITLAMFVMGLTVAVAQDDVYGSGKKDEGKKDVKTNTPVELTAGGAYEKQKVVTVEGVTAVVLYERAMMALSDWSGPDGMSKAGVDYQNQETHTVIYKGGYSLGFKNVFMGDGWKRRADFTLKVRCKDGRAQLTLSVPTITMTYNRNGATRTYTVAEVQDAVGKADGKKKERGVALMDDLTSTADGIMTAMTKRLKFDEEDDF